MMSAGFAATILAQVPIGSQAEFMPREVYYIEPPLSRATYIFCSFVLMVSIIRILLQVIWRIRRHPVRGKSPIGLHWSIGFILIGFLAFLSNLHGLLSEVKRFGSLSQSVMAGSLAETLRPLIFGTASAMILYALHLLSRVIVGRGEHKASNPQGLQ